MQWRSYEQNMPSACVSQNVGNYVDRHNPEVYFPSDRAQCLAWDLPLGTLSGGPLVDALDANALPAFSFITPDVCEDMHSCRTRTGDDWLSQWVPRIVASPGYQDGSTAIFITFDEGEGGHSYDCTDNTTDIGCHVATIVVSPSTPSVVTARESCSTTTACSRPPSRSWGSGSISGTPATLKPAAWSRPSGSDLSRWR